ncbi:nuclear transport factor 2 family protein [Cellulosimicrobium sp. CUA-896]|uniref:nuclear transport factor 2 family protein n=1 Tax=Cellulosimicrobium sp. CUA-896 TaxID=1517881 RepID=UPI001C9E296B|nr:nuclear transport factor 2 family protein [Cellulosimicrobium sp. CUA-896]
MGPPRQKGDHHARHRHRVRPDDAAISRRDLPRARDEDRYDDATGVFAPDATVFDEGTTYSGTEQIRAWVARSSTEYTYTSTRIGQDVADDSRAVVLVRLDGNFPGGTATLRYQFELQDGLITRLAIEV